MYNIRFLKHEKGSTLDLITTTGVPFSSYIFKKKNLNKNSRYIFEKKKILINIIVKYSLYYIYIFINIYTNMNYLIYMLYVSKP